MEVLAAIAVILLIILIILVLFIPSLALVFGMGLVSKQCFPRKNLWFRWGGVLVTLLLIPQILNVIIERDITRVFSQSHGEIPSDISGRIVAVAPYSSAKLTILNCGKSCILLLLSGKIDQYLEVQRTSDLVNLNVTAFRFEKNVDCSFMDDFVGRHLSPRLENTIRELSLSGTCLTSRETTLDIADVLVTYDKVQSSSWLMPPIVGQKVSVSQRDHKTDDWKEIYRNVAVKYDRIFPILLPAFTLDKKRYPIDVLRSKIYRTQDKKIVCNKDWFSEYGPCYRQPTYTSVIETLGISVSEYSLEKSGIISSKFDRTLSILKLVKVIISEDRQPTPNEWALITRHISSEYYDSSVFADLVIDVVSYENFPVPSFFFGVDKLDEDQKALLASAVVKRIGKDMPGPEIGNSNEKQQWYNLYKIIEKLPVDILEPYFDDLVSAVPKRSNKKQYVDFFKKFSSRSRQPILDIIKADKKRLASLSPVMCRLGDELSGIEGPLMEMAQTGHIRLNRNYGQVIFLLLDIGVEESRILNTVNPDAFQASSQTNSIKRFIEKYRAGKNRCR